MNKEFFILPIIVILFSASIAFSGQYECLESYERMTREIENGGSAARAGDVCDAADHIEMALNWLGTCEKECSYDSERMGKLYPLKKQLTNLLIEYVKKCGH